MIVKSRLKVFPGKSVLPHWHRFSQETQVGVEQQLPPSKGDTRLSSPPYLYPTTTQTAPSIQRTLGSEELAFQTLACGKSLDVQNSKVIENGAQPPTRRGLLPTPASLFMGTLHPCIVSCALSDFSTHPFPLTRPLLGAFMLPV